MSKRVETLEYWQNERTKVQALITQAIMGQETENPTAPPFLVERLKIINEKIAALEDPDLLDFPD